MKRNQSPWRMAVAVAVMGPLAACDDTMDGVGGLFGPNPGVLEEVAATGTMQRPGPDERGVITYATYQVMVARGGETIAEMAQRVRLFPEELANHNGLPVTYRPRTGEVLALPRNVGGSPTDNAWSPDAIAAGIEATPLPPAPTPGTPIPPPEPRSAAQTPFDNGQTGQVIDPIRHRVEPGETAFTIARLYGVSVTALSSWNGLDRDMTVRIDQELLIPVVNNANSIQGAPDQPAAANDPGESTSVPPPPSAVQPLPANEDLASIERPESPNLAQDRTPPGAQNRLLAPIAGAAVLRGYDPGGARPNEGLDFAADAGTPVRAAEAGEIALISQSLGGLGTIVLIRHADNLLTVYGRITDVTLTKGAKVRRGQTIGRVAPGDPPNLHFEVRRGTQSVDPTPYL